MEQIQSYFSGERLQCSIGIAISLISIALATYFWNSGTPLFKGIAYPFFPISILLLIICVGVVWRTPKDVARVSQYAVSEPAKLKTEELKRMEQVMQNFKTIKRVEVVLFGVGLLLLFFGGNPLLKGIGLGLLVQASVMFLFDTFAEKRGQVYWEYLNAH
jgi:hypothetical protein